MIRNPVIPYRYNVPETRDKWIKDESDGSYHSKTYRVVTIECESFEEFKAHHMTPDVIMSRQPNPWYISFMVAGECAECEWPIPASREGDYLCNVCRDME